MSVHPNNKQPDPTPPGETPKVPCPRCHQLMLQQGGELGQIWHCKPCNLHIDHVMAEKLRKQGAGETLPAPTWSEPLEQRYQQVQAFSPPGPAPEPPAPVGNAPVAPEGAEPGGIAVPEAVSARILEEKRKDFDVSLQKLSEERQQYYGDPRSSFRTLGMQFTALIEQHYNVRLSHPIPAHLASAMLAEMKINRISTNGKFNDDTYRDAMNYIRLSREVDERRPK